MTRTHLSVNQHAIHHIHARFMSNIIVGPGGQATFVAPAQSESSTSIASSVSSSSPVTFTQQASSSSLPTVVGPTNMSASDAATSTSTFVPAEASTTIVVTELLTSSSDSSSSTATSSSSLASSSLMSSSLVYSTSASSNVVSSSIAPSTTTFPTDSQINSSSTTVSPSGSSFTPIPTRALPASSTDVATANSASKEPTLYIGIVLGTIIVIACIAALVAWWFRIRNHSRRHKKVPAVPWASRRESSISSFAGADALEKGESHSTDIDPHQRIWEPRGDRDSGEPKRTKSYLENILSPTKRRLGPILGLPSPPPVVYPFHAHPAMPASYSSSLSSIPNDVLPVSLGPLPDSIAYPLPNVEQSRPPPPQPGYLQFKPDLLPDPPHSVHMQFLTDPEFGTPRESMMRPRYLSLHEQGLGVPWNPEAPELALESCQYEEIPSIVPSVLPQNLHVPSSPVSLSPSHARVQDSTSVCQGDVSSSSSAQNGWSSSLKANLVYAYNAVAKAAGAHTASDEECDKLTPLPSRNSSRIHKKDTRTSLAPETGWVEYFGGELVGKSPSQIELEETSEGKGIVHIRTSISEVPRLPLPGCVESSSMDLGLSLGLGLGMGLQSYRGDDHAFSPRPSSTSSSRKSSVMPYASTEALVVNKRNPSVTSRGTIRSNASQLGVSRLRNGSQRRPKYAYGGESCWALRSGSVASRAPRLPALPSFGRSETVKSTASSRSSFSRMSSIKSNRSVMTVLSDREEIARKALMERLRRSTSSGTKACLFA